MQSLEGTPGKYLALAQFQSGVDSIGDTTVGYLSYTDKDGKYPIVPKAAAFLQFRTREGGWVRTHLVMHPYPKGAASVTAMLLQSKPWIIDQLSESVRDGLR